MLSHTGLFGFILSPCVSMLSHTGLLGYI